MVKKKRVPKNVGRLGRTGVYCPELPERVMAVAKIGGTTRDMARALGVDHDTIEAWIDKYPEFYEAVERGREEFYKKTAVVSLAKRVAGYDWFEETYERTPVKSAITENGKTFERITGYEMILTKKVKKHVPAAVDALVFYMCNRMSNEWKHTQDGSGSSPTIHYHFSQHIQIPVDAGTGGRKQKGGFET